MSVIVAVNTKLKVLIGLTRELTASQVYNKVYYPRFPEICCFASLVCLSKTLTYTALTTL